MNSNSTDPAAFANIIILEDGKGDVATSWNGGPWNFYSSVSTIQVLSWEPHPIGIGTNVFLYSLAPLQAPQTVNVGLIGLVNNLFVHAPSGGAPLTVNAVPVLPLISQVSTTHF